MEAYEKVLDGSFLGRGYFGHVEKVRRKRDSKILACKTIWFADVETSKAERECKILKQLDHPNIVQQSEVEWLEHHVKIYMEYCEGGSLKDLIDERKKEEALLSEEYVWTIAYQLALALLYCHAGLRIDGEGYLSSDSKNIPDWKTILHRDIKPANVLMMNRSETALNSIKLGDFGLGYVLQNDNHPGSYVGTPQFLAPEIEGPRRSAGPIHWTTDCDMFSFGCTLYTLCKLTPPFAHHLEAEHESYSPIPDIYTSHLKDLIASCLSFSPDSRPKNALHLFQQCQRRVTCLRDERKSIPRTLPPHWDESRHTQMKVAQQKRAAFRKDVKIPTPLSIPAWNPNWAAIRALKDTKPDKNGIKDTKLDENDLKDMKHEKNGIKNTELHENDLKDMMHDKNDLKDMRHDKNGFKDTKHSKNGTNGMRYDKNGTRDMRYDKNGVRYKSWANVVARDATLVKKT